MKFKPPDKLKPCQKNSVPAGLFFSEDAAELEQAKALCAVCPEQLSCFRQALANGEWAGVWGGRIFYKGQVVAEIRRRGRPSRAAVAEQFELDELVAKELVAC